jgi:hypothetical protein
VFVFRADRVGHGGHGHGGHGTHLHVIETGGSSKGTPLLVLFALPILLFAGLFLGYIAK